jgi:hypothetical protein
MRGEVCALSALCALRVSPWRFGAKKNVRLKRHKPHNRPRKKSGPGRKDVPQGLKPDVFSIIYDPTKVVP